MPRLNHPALRSVTGLCLALGVLLMPATPGTGPMHALPISLAVIVALLVLAHGRTARLLAMTITAGLLVLALFKALDLAVDTAYDRVFNPVVDTGLLPAAWHLGAGTFGLFTSGLVIVAATVGLAALAGLMFWGLGGLSRLAFMPRHALGIAAGVGLLSFGLGRALPVDAGLAARLADGITADNPAYVMDRVLLVTQTYHRLARFDQRLAHDPLADRPPAELFSALAGRDVMVIFIESYGRSAIEDSRYADTVQPTLSRIEQALTAAHRHVLSGWLHSPTMGGMSWLAHGALLSGLWTDNQKRYDAMIASDRASLNRLFRRAGWTTVAAMPAITMAWPEAAWFWNVRIYGADELGYAGKPFNWVTMPDQYTLSAIHRIVADINTPTMIETALISSHAPWTPIPHLVPWDQVGDGTVFNPQTTRGDSPAEVWADPARVRRQYEKAVNYSLATVGQYMARFGDNTVFIVLGDHQPAPIITGERASRDVPIHIVTDDATLLERLDTRYWTPGMQPASTLPDRPMSAFRAVFTQAMSGP